MSYIYSNLVSFACVIAATTLALHDKQGWGWFLLIALLTYCIGSSDGGDDDEDN